MGIIIKGIVAIERVATFPETKLRHFSFFDVWNVVDSMKRISKDGLLSTGGKIDGVLEAEEKRGRSYPAAVLVNAWPNQLDKHF